MFEGEEWRPVVGMPHYEVSSHGRVRNASTGEIRKLSVSDRGFPCLTLYGADSMSRYFRQVNKLVADAFLQPSVLEVNNSIWHIDGNLHNCHVDNLRWETKGRVMAWNDMHRSGQPKFNTPPVRNNRTGDVYDNAYLCALAEGDLEETIVWKVENGSPRFSYV